MSIAATGPRSEAGKARSSRNALAYGLYTGHDHVLPDENEAYESLRSGLADELSPATPIEDALAASILSAIWKLRRCGLTESNFACLDGSSAEQTSVDRARAQAHNLLRRSLTELRRLKTDRATERELMHHEKAPPVQSVISWKDVISTLKAEERGAQLILRNAIERAACAPMPQTPPASSFCKNDDLTHPAGPVIARSAPCPCGSGEKYKRCCGKNAPPVLHSLRPPDSKAA